METGDLKETLSSQSMRTAAATFVSYGVVIAVMTLALFGIPWLVFTLF